MKREVARALLLQIADSAAAVYKPQTDPERDAARYCVAAGWLQECFAPEREGKREYLGVSLTVAGEAEARRGR